MSVVLVQNIVFMAPVAFSIIIHHIVFGCIYRFLDISWVTVSNTLFACIYSRAKYGIPYSPSFCVDVVESGLVLVLLLSTRTTLSKLCSPSPTLSTLSNIGKPIHGKTSRTRPAAAAMDAATIIPTFLLRCCGL